jgi:hypothetical protein
MELVGWRDFDSFVILLQPGIGSLQLQSARPLQRRIGSRLNPFSSAGGLYAVPIRSAIASNIRVRQCWLQFDRLPQREDSLFKPALLKIDQSQAGVDFGCLRRQLAKL